jgi:hypothetical protein
VRAKRIIVDQKETRVVKKAKAKTTSKKMDLEENSTRKGKWLLQLLQVMQIWEEAPLQVPMMKMTRTCLLKKEWRSKMILLLADEREMLWDLVQFWVAIQHSNQVQHREETIPS